MCRKTIIEHNCRKIFDDTNEIEMKNRLVIWGTNEKEEKKLLLFNLNEKEDKVELTLLPHEEVPEDLYQKLMDEWRKGDEVELPENKEEKEIKLQFGDSILPENIKTKQTDLVHRTQAEWQFFVASHKLYDLYKSEAEDFKDKILSNGEYNNSLWEELKGFWAKVQAQIKDRNLFGFHIDDLRTRVDELFNEMKTLRKKKDEELKEQSKPIFESYQERLNKIQSKVDEGLSLKPIFEELKRVQKDFKNERLQRDYQNKLWNRIDELFKIVKKKRFGDVPTGSDKLSKLQRRLQGLERVISNMESSIEHEKKNLYYENKRKDHSSGELESQLREAKLKMIEERLHSKESKLEDILNTKTSILSQIERAKVEKAKKEEQEKIEAAKKEAKERIKNQIQEQAEEIDSDAVIKAVEATTESIPSQKASEEKDINISIASQVAASLTDILPEEE